MEIPKNQFTFDNKVFTLLIFKESGKITTKKVFALPSKVTYKCITK